ncbi:uncharacterized protein LOC124388075 [Silurus meridionalis]|uniref:Uncharacterized protein n=1 Tax=Silurus meridionalis TaxID=175797 RepID=A0A8T0BJF8_SILME|nr:uncharacterized protein LOC124388075 [Silurus meridionalis]KAF7706263.1 hypothetical protein HF521_019517 [Silurus meridionalis]
MFCGYWTVMRVMCFSVALAGVFTEQDCVTGVGNPGLDQSAMEPAPTIEIIRKGEDLHFHSSPPKLEYPQCWKHRFEYTKCNEDPIQVCATYERNWTATVQYDVACRYAVKVQALFDEQYCGKDYYNSEISEPVYFGNNSDLDLPFTVAMIAIPVIMCACLIVAMLLFRRHKEKFLPKVPSPANFLKDMFDNNKEMTKVLYVGELYVPNEEVEEAIHVEPKTASQILINKT